MNMDGSSAVVTPLPAGRKPPEEERATGFAQRFGLQFQPGQEASFRKHSLPSAVLLSRMTMFMGGLMIALVVLVDQFGMGYRYPVLVHNALLFLCFPVSMALGLLSFLPPVRQYSPALNAVMLVGNVAIFLWCYPQLVYNSAAPPYSFEGLLVVIAFTYSFSGLLFWPSAIIGAGSAIGFMLVMSDTSLTSGALVYCTFYLMAVNVVGLMGGYLNEYYRRAHFLASEKLHELAERDPLTSVYNRRAFSERLDNLVRQARRDGLSITVLVIDVDHFKDVNDGAGHHFGDLVLIAAANALTEASRRPLDYVARLGGDEFVAVWFDLGAPHLTRACEALQLGFAQHFAPLTAKHGHRITMSVGAAHAVPAPWHDGETMLKYADDALYETKANGRNGFTIVRVDEHPVVEARSERVDEPISRNRAYIGR